MKDKSNIRIVDIARMAGVSAGTVDRVLHKRGHVSEDKREKIEKVLKEINYEPNLVASFLASKRNFKFAVLIPSFGDGDYWQLAYEGIQAAEEELKNFKVNVEFFQFDQYDRDSFIKATAVLSDKNFDAAIIATLFGKEVIQFSELLNQKEIPYIYIDSNIPDQNNLAYFGGDSHGSGYIAAKLLLKEIEKDADILITYVRFKHKTISVQMQSRETGFIECLRDNAYSGSIKHLELNPDDSVLALQELETLLQKAEKPIGGIVLNSRIYELVPLLDKLDPALREKIRLIGHDPIERNVNALKQGQVSFVLSQRPEQQGYDAVKSLVNYFVFKHLPSKVNYMPIDILIKENVDYYNSYKL